MAEDPNLRRDFISRIGTFFIVISLFLIIIFVASDISRNNVGSQVSATQTYIVAAVQAIQTRDAGATEAAPLNLPTPTMISVPSRNSDSILTYLPAFCLGAIGLLVGWFFKRISAPPGKPSGRFEGLRKMQEKQREAKAKREAKKKEKEKEKKK
jgi:hypothetical protein